MCGIVGVLGSHEAAPLLVEAFRGSEAEIRSRLDRWLPELRGHEPVLDLGCGRGELLLMLCDAGVEAEGVDGDPALVQAARRRGLAVVEGDVLEVLRGRADASAGAITALHLAEHLEPTTLLAVLAESPDTPDAMAKLGTLPSPSSGACAAAAFTAAMLMSPKSVAFVCQAALRSAMSS